MLDGFETLMFRPDSDSIKFCKTDPTKIPGSANLVQTARYFFFFLDHFSYPYLDRIACGRFITTTPIPPGPHIHHQGLGKEIYFNKKLKNIHYFNIKIKLPCSALHQTLDPWNTL